MRKLFTLIVFFILLGLMSCNTVRVTHDYDRQAEFNKYKTFSFHQKGIDALKMNDLDKRRIVIAIDENLKSKGMTLALKSKADIIINIYASNKTRVDVDPWYNPWWTYGPYWGNRLNIRSYKEGSIVVDLIDRQKNTLVWQGVGKGLNISNIKAKEKAIPKAINEIMVAFPPQK